MMTLLLSGLVSGCVTPNPSDFCDLGVTMELKEETLQFLASTDRELLEDIVLNNETIEDNCSDE